MTKKTETLDDRLSADFFRVLFGGGVVPEPALDGEDAEHRIAAVGPEVRDRKIATRLHAARHCELDRELPHIVPDGGDIGAHAGPGARHPRVVRWIAKRLPRLNEA